MIHQQLIFSHDIGPIIDKRIDKLKPKGIFVLVDTNTKKYVLPYILTYTRSLASAEIITIPAGDVNKNLNSLAHVWKQLSDLGATRSSLLVNIGGGVVTDLGAFAASTFKRGIRFINIPTTLLAAVDASVGGKTGINFNGLKNEVGTFSEADTVIISTIFFHTLPIDELKSGYAEMLKHSLLTSATEFTKLTDSDIIDLSPGSMLTMLERSVEVKRHIVYNDPTERGVRKALNLGHTAGHAFETLAMERTSPIPHGYAVAYGLVVALILSHMKLGMATNNLYRLVSYIERNYGTFEITCDDYGRLLELMSHDKKNERPDSISFTLLKAIGDYKCGITVSADDIKSALDIYRDLMHLA